MQASYILGTKAVGDQGVLSPDEEIALLYRIGFGAFFTEAREDLIPRFAAAARDVGIAYASVHSGCLAHFMWGEYGTEDDSAAAQKKALREIELCSEFEIPYLVLHPSVGSREEAPPEIGYERYAQLFRRAEQCGVTLAFENLSSKKYLEAIMKTFGDSPACGFCYDSGHALAYTNGTDLLKLYQKHLVLTHLHDNFGRRGDRITSDDDLHIFPFDGLVDWDFVAGSLKAASYTGILMAEVKYSPTPGNYIYDTYNAPSLEQFYQTVYERLLRIEDRILK